MQRSIHLLQGERIVGRTAVQSYVAEVQESREESSPGQNRCSSSSAQSTFCTRRFQWTPASQGEALGNAHETSAGRPRGEGEGEGEGGGGTQGDKLRSRKITLSSTQELRRTGEFSQTTWICEAREGWRGSGICFAPANTLKTCSHMFSACDVIMNTSLLAFFPTESHGLQRRK